jgi:ribosomal protein S10
MFFYIKISSKSSESLKTYVMFLTKIKKLKITIKQSPKKELKKVITILKSPHVDKSAQEQFESRVYTKQLVINSSKYFKVLSFLKRVHNNIFPSVNIEIQGLFEKRNNSKHLFKIVDPDSAIRINLFHSNSQLIGLKTKKYLQLFDCYGEYITRKIVSDLVIENAILTLPPKF